MKDNTVYTKPFEYASENGETELFHSSAAQNSECLSAIGKAIDENFNNYILDSSCIEPIINEYGMERVSYVLAHIVNRSLHDGRYSSDNKNWAMGFDTSALSPYLTLNTHPTLLDSITKRVREREPKITKTKSPPAKKKKPRSMER